MPKRLKAWASNLITDRTYEDVKNRTSKGYYSDYDLKRIQNTMRSLGDFFTEYDYYLKLYYITSLSNIYIPTLDDTNMILNNISYLCRAVTTITGIPPKKTTPSLPADMDCLNYREANNIEKNLEEALRRTAEWLGAGW